MKHSHNKVSYNHLESPTQADHNSRRSHYSPVFSFLFSCSSCGKLENTLVTFNLQKPCLFIFSFLTKEQTPHTFLECDMNYRNEV